MALDEPKDEDQTLQESDKTFLMAPEVVAFVGQNGGLTIDFVDDGQRKGYTVNVGSAGDDCGGCGETCG